MKKGVVFSIALMYMVTLSSCRSSDDLNSSQFEIVSSTYTETSNEFNEGGQSFEVDANVDYVNNLSYIDEQINCIILDESYKKSSTKDKVMSIEALLKQLLDEGFITDYQFELNSERPHVSFDYVGGGSGIVVFDELPEDQN